MYWYLEKEETRPRRFLEQVRDQMLSGAWDKLDKEQQTKIHEQANFYNRAKGRYLYQPNKKCYWWFLQPHMVKALRGGNQSGKSTACIIDCLMKIEGWHPLQKANMERIIEEGYDPKVVAWLKKLHEARIFLKDPPVKVRSVAVDYTKFVTEILGPGYVHWATQDDLDEIAYDNDKKRRIKWKNRSHVHFLTMEMPVLSHGGAAVDVVQHDEEPPSGIWAQSRMRISTTNGRMVLGMTAEQGTSWTEDEIFRYGLAKKHHPHIFALEMSTYDNPVVDQSQVDAIKATCHSEAEIAIRIYGKAAPRGGRVYEMARDDHPWVIDPFDIPQDKGYILMMIDPHGKLPHAVLWMWVDYDGLYHPLFQDKPNIYNIAEIFEPCNIPTLRDHIRLKETYEIGREHDFCLVDPAAWNTDQNNPKTVANQLEDVGLAPTKATRDRTSGIVKVQEMLSLQIGRYLPEDGPEAKVLTREYPQIMTFSTCETLRWERNKYRWKRSRSRFTEDTAVSQKPVDKDDHFMENEYRGALFVVDGDMDMIENDDNSLFIYGVTQKGAPVIVGGNKMDVDFSDQNNDITDACLM